MNRNCYNSKAIGSKQPYPEIKVLGANQYYAELLMNDYSGMVSELTAINQYLYHSFVIPNNDNYLVEMLEGIAINEMQHLEILAQLINMLGEKPLYRDSNNHFWNGSYVYYGNNLYDQLQANIEAEYAAISNYQMDIEIINDPYIQTILQRIIEDEKVHIELFKEAMRKYNYNQK